MTAPRVLSLRLVPASLVGFFSADAAGAAAAPAIATLNGGQAVVGQPLAVALQVVDQNDTPVSGVFVQWNVLRGSGSPDATTSVSDTGGIVRVNWTLDTIAKLDSMRASLTSGTGAVVTASGVHAAPASATKVSGDAQTVPLDATSSPFVLRVADRFGNPVGGTLIAWDVIAGDGRPNHFTSRTDVNGVAAVTVTAGTTPSDGRLLATFGVIQALAFSFTAQ